MADAAATPAAPPPAKQDDEDGGLVLDELSERLTTLAVLREDDPDARGLLLEEIGVRGKVEEDIVSQLSAHRPLWRPDRFEEAHRLAMRSLEVLDRNGSRTAAMPRKVGPLKPVAEWTVQQITRFVVKDHQNRVIESLCKLYSRREANSAWDSKEHHMLRRARIDATRVETGFKGKAIGLPGFLLGGAFISGVVSSGIRFIQGALQNTLLTVIVGITAALILIGGAWSAIYGAAVARRRVRLALDQPLRALYETIGACGNPPKDQSTNFAVIAIVMFVLAWVIVPAALYFIFT